VQKSDSTSTICCELSDRTCSALARLVLADPRPSIWD